MAEAHQLSNIQKELLKLYAHNISDDDLLEIKHLLASYFVQKIDTEMDNVFEQNNWDMGKIEEWKKSHLRTPYNKR